MDGTLNNMYLVCCFIVLSLSDIHILIGEDLYSRPTINRDLVKLLDNNIIKQYYFMGLQLPKEQVLQDQGYLIVI
jgi:hypothetical protein